MTWADLSSGPGLGDGLAGDGDGDGDGAVVQDANGFRRLVTSAS